MNPFRVLVLAGLLAVSSAADAEEVVSYDELPVPVTTTLPEYPRHLRKDGLSGVVSLSVRVSETGKVTDAKVVKSTHKDFEEPALAAVKEWRFKPATKGGKPVELTIRLPLKFSLKD